MGASFIVLPTREGDLYIRPSEILLIEPTQVDDRMYCSIIFRLKDHTSSRLVLDLAGNVAHLVVDAEQP